MISIEHRDGLTEITLSSPSRRNALDRATVRELAAVLGVGVGASRALILTGSAGVFSAGADLHELQGTAEDLAFDALLSEVVQAIERQSRPVIAAVDGACMGAAVELALACDMCVASTSSFFELPAVRLGILYNPRSIAGLHRTLPRQALTRLILLGERLDAQSAAHLGLVTRLASGGEALSAARELAHAAAACDATAFASTKSLLRALDQGEHALDRFEAIRSQLVQSPARRAALEAARNRNRTSGGGAQ